MPPQFQPEQARERVALAMFVAMGAFLGVLVPYVLFFAPVPLAVLVYRHGLRTGTVTALSVGLGVGLISHPINMLVVLMVLGVGVAFGEALRDQLSLSQTLVVGWLITLVALAVPYVADLFMPEVNGIEQAMQEVRQYLEEVLRASGIGEAELSSAEVQAFVQQMERLLPAIAAMWAGLVAVVNYFAISGWLRRLGAPVPLLTPFSRWRFSPGWAWAYIIAGGLPLLEGFLRLGSTTILLAANLQTVGAALFMVQGTAVLSFYLDRWRVLRLLKFVVLVAALLVSPFVPHLLVLVGLLDTWFDFRRLGRQEPPAAPSSKGE